LTQTVIFGDSLVNFYFFDPIFGRRTTTTNILSVERPLGLRCAVAVAPNDTFDPLGSGGGILCQDSRPASVSGGLSGSTFEDPEAVL
jgi:hypothetical protein